MTMTTMKNQPLDITKKNGYRLTGLLYLIVIVCAGLSQGYIRGTLVVPGDAANTATNILNNEGLFRMGLSLDLIAFIVDAIISVLLYQLFKPYGKTLAMISSALRLIAHPAIGSLEFAEPLSGISGAWRRRVPCPI